MRLTLPIACVFALAHLAIGQDADQTTTYKRTVLVFCKETLPLCKMVIEGAPPLALAEFDKQHKKITAAWIAMKAAPDEHLDIEKACRAIWLGVDKTRQSLTLTHELIALRGEDAPAVKQAIAKDRKYMQDMKALLERIEKKMK